MEYKNELLHHWVSGVNDFNQGRYWHAHEHWEKGWLKLRLPERLYVQAMIQVCGAFHLALEKKRYEAALRLAQSALKKILEFQTLSVAQLPSIEIIGVEKVLDLILENSLHRTNIKEPEINWRFSQPPLSPTLPVHFSHTLRQKPFTHRRRARRDPIAWAHPAGTLRARTR